MYRLLCAAVLILFATLAHAQNAPDEPMTQARLVDILIAVDPDTQVSGNQAQLTIRDVPVVIIMDPVADRMRAVVPIRAEAGIDGDELRRLMQANFDTALDARYAIANGRLWSTFIHPLSPLERDQFLSGLGQTVNLALSYGTLYSGGGLSFGGGDSGERQRELIEELLQKGEEI